MGIVLAVKDLVVNYGAVQALKGVTLELGDRDIVAVLGANGAGKTTLLKSISHIQPVRSGSVLFNGTDLATVPALRLAELGIAHVPEGRQVFATLTTEENLNVGAYGVRIQPGDIVITLHGQAANSVLTPAAFARRYNGAANPDAELLKQLDAAGVSVRLCGQSMIGQGFSRDELNPVVKVDVAAITTMATLQLQGYAIIQD